MESNPRLVPTLLRGNALPATLRRRSHVCPSRPDAGASEVVRSHARAWERGVPELSPRPWHVRSSSHGFLSFFRNTNHKKATFPCPPREVMLPFNWPSWCLVEGESMKLGLTIAGLFVGIVTSVAQEPTPSHAQVEKLISELDHPRFRDKE